MKFCTTCGTRADGPTDRWCGTCGAEFPSQVPEAAVAPPTPPVVAPTDPVSPFAPQAAGIATPLTAEALTPQTTRRRRTPVVVGGALVGVLAVVGIGVGVTKVMSDPTGAGSAEEAVASVLDSITSQDPVSAVRVINPDEASGLDKTVDLTVERIKKAGFDQGGKFTDAIDVQFENVEYEVEPLGEGAAKVIFDGNVKASFDPKKLPEHMRDDPDMKADSISDDLSELMEGSAWTDWDKDRTEVYLVTVKHDGRWYVSPTATMMELIADDADVPGGDFDADTLASSDPAAESPDDAVSGLLSAVEDGDVAEAAGHLVTGQGDLVRAYRESFERLMDREAGSWSAETSARTTSEVNGSQAIVTINEATLGGTIETESDYSYGSLSIDGDCIDADGDTECIGDELEEITGIKDFQVVTEKEGNNWRVDLYGTAMRYLEGAAKNVPQDALAEVFEAPFLAERLPVATGQDVQLEFDSVAGTPLRRLIEIDVTAGKTLRVYAPGEDEVWFQRVRGGSTSWSENGDFFMTPVEADGVVRLFVHSGGEKSITVRADLVDPQPIGEGEAMSAGEVYTFTAESDTDYEYDYDTDLNYCLIEDDKCVESWDGWEAGTYLVGSSEDGATAPTESDYYSDDYYDY